MVRWSRPWIIHILVLKKCYLFWTLYCVLICFPLWKILSGFWASKIKFSISITHDQQTDPQMLVHLLRSFLGFSSRWSRCMQCRLANQYGFSRRYYGLVLPSQQAHKNMQWIGSCEAWILAQLYHLLIQRLSRITFLLGADLLLSVKMRWDLRVG